MKKMTQLDLIIEALRVAYYELYSEGVFVDELDLYAEALKAARELRDEIYTNEMEQPTPGPRRTVIIQNDRASWYKYATNEQLLDEVRLRNLKIGHAL